MLGPDWKEGRDMLDHDGTTELSLPDDNAAALEVICSVLHHQNREILQTLTAADILAVAVAADKYDFVNALRFASDSWLRPSQGDAGKLSLLTTAAYLFQNVSAFREFTRALVLEYDGPYLALFCKEVEDGLPWEVLCEYLDDESTYIAGAHMGRSA